MLLHSGLLIHRKNIIFFLFLQSYKPSLSHSYPYSISSFTALFNTPVSAKQNRKNTGKRKILCPPTGKAGSLIVQFPNGDNITPRHPYFPKSVPKDIGRRLVNANADPFAWWMGQFFRYAMRTASGFRDHVEKLRARLGFESPIVGWVSPRFEVGLSLRHFLLFWSVSLMCLEVMLTLM